MNCAQAVPPLPPPTDIPTAPSEVVSPGGTGLPDMVSAEPATDAPAISAISETTLPDETLVITGENLTDAELVVWHEGGIRTLEPLCATHNKMLAVLPRDVPASTLLVWPTRGMAVGRPIRVNGSSAWWLWPPTVEYGPKAGTVKVIGKNLTLTGSKPAVCLTGPEGSTVLTPSLSEPYQLEVTLPDTLPSGQYEIRTHNGTGSIHGWSKPLQLTVVRTVQQQPETVFRPEDFGARADDASDNADAIQRTADAAGRAGGGTIRFGPGTYAVSKPVILAGNSLQVEGVGKGTYDPATDSIRGVHTCIRRIDPTDLSLPEAIFIVEGSSCGIRNIALRNNHNGNRQNVLRITGEKTVVSNVLLTMFDKRDWGGGTLGPPKDRDGILVDVREGRSESTEPHLIGHWDFEEEGPAIKDISGCGNNATLHGIRIRGAFGNAVRFPYRATALVPGRRLSPADALTLSAWFLSDSPDFEKNRTVIRKDKSYALRFADSRLGFLLWHNGGIVALCSPKLDWKNGEWHHLAATFDGRTLAMCLDGETCGKRELDETISVDQNEDDVHIGGMGIYSLRGALGDLRVRSEALSPERVQAEFAADRERYSSGESTVSTCVGFADPANPVGLLNTGAIQLHTKGSALARIEDCEIHCVGPGVEISPNIFTRERTDPANPEPMEPSTDDVLVRRCVIRGYYGGEPDRLPSAGASGRTVGIVIHNGKRIIVEHCDFAGADRYHRRILNRTVLSLNTGNRWLYFGNNTSMDVGTHRSATGMDRNQGEQYLIHYRYVPGGLFHVLESTPTETTIDTRKLSIHQEEAEYQTKTFLWNPVGSQIPAEVGKNEHWVLFISKGRGAGQYRQIPARSDEPGRTTLALQSPWRVAPDQMSRVHLIPVHRNMILYGNTVDGGQQVLTDKTHGVTFWYWTFDTIVAENTFRNMTAGVVYNSRYTGPVGWNLIRGNTIENMWGYTGDTSEKAALYVDHFRSHTSWAAPEDRVWYSVGNICRGNRGENAPVAAFLHRRPQPAVPELVSGPETDSGMVLSVIENNTFRDTVEGIVVSAPTNCCLLRNNSVETASKNANTIRDISPGLTDCVILP